MKRSHILLIVIAAVIVLLIALTARRNNEDVSVTPTATSTSPTDGSSTSTAKNPLAYAEALKLYLAGKRIQIIQCQSVPVTSTIKRGTRFMIDNRDAVARRIMIGDQVYQIDAFDFAIATSGAPNTYNVTCEGAPAAQITVIP